MGLTKERLSKWRRGEIDDSAAVHGVNDVAQEPSEEEELVAPEEQEQAGVDQRLPTPLTPTRTDMLDHRVTHCPFWASCPDCVDGRGKEVGHFACPPTDSRGVPTVSFDYGFKGNRGKIISQDGADEEPVSIKVLVVRDN